MRSTPSGETQIRCWQEKKIWNPILRSVNAENPSGGQSEMVPILQCSIIPWNSYHERHGSSSCVITIPEPWANNNTISQEKRDFYQYYATMMEPWDGPASILFSDGDVMGAVLDRNGLRPSRYYVTDDGCMILSSEVGVLTLYRKRRSY